MIGRIDESSNPETIKVAFELQEELTGAYAPTLKIFNIGNPVKTLKYETSIDNETVTEGVIGAVAWNDTDVSGLSVDTALLEAITTYAVLKVEQEIVAVKEIDYNNGTITVFKRGMGDTVAASHTAGSVALVVGFNIVRGEKDIPANYKEQIIDFNTVGKTTVPSLKYTKEETVIERSYYDADGFDSYLAKQMLEKDKDLIEFTNKALIHGTREEGSSNTPSSTRGLIEEATLKGNVITNFGSLTGLSQLDIALKPSRNKKGRANIALVSSDVYDKFNGLATVENQKPKFVSRLNVELGQKVTMLNTIVGSLVLVMDLDMPTGTAIVLNQADLSIHPLVGFTTPGGDKTTAQESARNDQAFTYDSIAQYGTLYKNSNKNLTIITEIA